MSFLQSLARTPVVAFMPLLRRIRTSGIIDIAVPPLEES